MSKIIELMKEPIPDDVVAAAVKVSAYLQSIGGKGWCFMGICDRSFAEKEHDLKQNIKEFYEYLTSQEAYNQSLYQSQFSDPYLSQGYAEQRDFYKRVKEKFAEKFDFLPKK